MESLCSFSRTLLLSYGCSSCVSLFVCLLGAVIIYALRLYKKTVYRLSFYQVIAAALLSLACAGQLILLGLPEASGTRDVLCQVFAFLSVYAEWIKAMFASCSSLHLFCFVVFYKNLRKFEGLYVGTSLLLPLPFSIVPFVTHNYGPSESWCWIRQFNENCTPQRLGYAEQLGVWFLPATFLLLMASLGMAVMVISLICRLGRNSTLNNQNWKILKQLLPLAAYPLIFLFFIIPSIVYRSLNYVYGQNSLKSYAVIGIVSVQGWSLAAGVTLILHVLVAGVASHQKSRRGTKTYIVSPFLASRPYAGSRILPVVN